MLDPKGNAVSRLAPGALRLLAWFLLPALAAAQVPTPSSPLRAVAVKGADLHLGPDSQSVVVGHLKPCEDVAILERSGNFAHIFVRVSGWVPDQGLLPIGNLANAKPLFAEGARLEELAESASGQIATAKNAERCFYNVYDDFRASPLSAEALYRAASINWQLARADIPQSSDPSLQRFPSTHWLRLVTKKFPHTPWAEQAAYLIVDTKLTCGIWSRKPSCIDKEIHAYRDFLKKYPAGPRTAEAYYRIAFRQASAASLYRAAGPKHDPKKAERYRQSLAATVASMQRRFPPHQPGNRWTKKAESLLDQVQQGKHVGP